jgi:hypothetical protein
MSYNKIKDEVTARYESENEDKESDDVEYISVLRL